MIPRGTNAPALVPLIYKKVLKLHIEIRMKAPFLEKSYTDEIGMIYEDDYEEVSA